MTGSLPSVAVVIPVYNRAQVLARTLASLEAQIEPGELTVVVADDGSDEDIGGLVDNWKPPFAKLYLHQQHRGFGAARARNLGAGSTETAVVVFLDSDGLVGPDFVARHAAMHTGARDRVVIGGRVHLDGSGLEPEDIAGGRIDFESLTLTERQDFRTVLARRTSGLQHTDEGFRAFVSSNVSLPAELFSEVGGFDERFRWWGSEDSELGWRLWQAGADFVEERGIRIYHQLDADTAGGAEGREEARRLNRGLLTSLVPQRFYRKGMPEPPPEVPKVSVVVHDVPIGSAPAWWRSMVGQSLPDFELVFIADAAHHDPFAGAAEGERRVAFIPDPGEAVAATRGDYLLFLNGHAAPASTLVHNVARRLDGRPAAPSLGFGIEVQGAAHVRLEDVELLAGAWATALPLVQAVRRRALIRLLAEGQSLRAALDWLAADERHIHIGRPLAALPSTERAPRPEGFTMTRSPRRELYEAAMRGPVPLLKAGAGIVRPARSETRQPKPDQVSSQQLPGIRYVGWVGKDNLGDEAMLQAARLLMGWGEIETRGEARDLLLLGGGTLINRTHYLGWLTERDSPRIERAVFGTGVASPGYWGLTEDTSEWLRWLGTCAYVGVRGPRSAATLDEWGYKGEVEVCGDPALGLQPSKPYEGNGSILVAPAWTGGELWGESDLTVYGHLAEAIKTWVGQGRQVTLMSCHPTDDRPILLIRDMLDGAPVSYRPGYVDVEESMDLIATSGLVVGERLHACVLAAAAGRPFVSIEYRPKLLDFAESVGMDRYLVRTDELRPGRLLELAGELGDRPPEAMLASVADYRGRLAGASRTIQTALSG